MKMELRTSILISTILIGGVMSSSDTEIPQFNQVKCSQIKHDVSCEDVDAMEEPNLSRWPTGIYSVPMGIHGCPETASRGWKEGYLSITWNKPHDVYITSDTITTRDIAPDFDPTLNKWSHFQTVLFGPLGKYVFKLNFCHREGRNESLDTGKWPGGNYSIYGVLGGCSYGFSKHMKTIRLGEISYWMTDGYVPEFIIEESNGSATLRIAICSRDNAVDDDSSEVTGVDFLDTSFVLLKTNFTTCPAFKKTSLTPETVYLAEGMTDTINNISQLLLFEFYCSYRPDILHTATIEDLLERARKFAYVVSTKQILEGNTTDGISQNSILGNYGNPTTTEFESSSHSTWKLVDLGRTISVTAVWIHLPDDFLYNHDTDYIPVCQISKDKWCFLCSCSHVCRFQINYQNEQNTLQLLFLRETDGRYISITGRYIDSIVQISTEISVFTETLTYEGTEDCNADLGMTDGGILDFQISASSWRPTSPPASARPYHGGWCAHATDSRPYIQIDLLVATSVEGVTIWNWQETMRTEGSVVWDDIVHFGVDIFKVSYGNVSDIQIEYEQLEFHFDKTRPFQEPQTFWFLKSFTSRIVTIEILQPISENLNCLRFELLGCRVSGVPSLYCAQGGEMFQISPVPISTGQPVEHHNVSTFLECEEMCLQSTNCSSVSMDSSNTCMIHGHSTRNLIHMYQVNVLTEQWATKLCFEDHFVTVPTLAKFQSLAMSRSLTIELSSSNAIGINDVAVIVSPGYPFCYPSGQIYKWIVSFGATDYVKLIFTNISLHIDEQSSSTGTSCNDSIVVSDKIGEDGKQLARVIDNRFNGSVSIIETSKSRVVISFETCLPVTKKDFVGLGFRALVTKQNVPSCFSLDSTLSWETGREEICTHSSMTLTSMSLLGLPFVRTTEQWTIISQGRRIHLVIMEFNVACKTEDSKSEFRIIDLYKDTTYCNLNRPPDEISSSSDTLLVTFFKDADPPFITFKEGFRLVYDILRESLDHWIDYQSPRSYVNNVALGKPAIMSSTYIYQYPTFLSAGKATDGTVHLDAAFGACFHTKSQREPWWMVDLQGIYFIDRIVLYNKQENNAAILARNIEIAVGMDVSDMTVTSSCNDVEFRKTFNQHNIRARFVKLQVRNYFTKFHLCEIEIYGVLDYDIDEEAKREFTYPNPVNGNWADWASWSKLCYCNHTQPRTRECNNPSPNFGGRDCPGSTTSFRSCIPDINCNITNVALQKSANMSSSGFAWSFPELATDGSTLQTELFCFKTQYQYQPWWIVDLQAVFHLETVVIYTRSYANARTSIDLEFSVGLTACEMEVVYSKCGKGFAAKESITIIDAVAKYFKIQFIGTGYLNLCEVEIYGQIANSSAEGLPICNMHMQVDGRYSSWSQWSSCSEKCGIGTRRRARTCSNPAPVNGGRSCHGNDIDVSNCVGSAKCLICSKRFGKCYSLFPALTNWHHAGYACWRRNMQLVAMRSKEELLFVKYLLRKYRYPDKLPMATFDSVYTNASYYAHIGLYRLTVTDGVTVDMWEDTTPVIFTAWKRDEPSGGMCVRMNYKSYDDTNTWESEDCNTVLAEYYVCEQRMGNITIGRNKELPEQHGADWAKVPEQIRAGQYTGTANTTKSGMKCNSWLQEPNDPYAIIWYRSYMVHWRMEQSKEEAENYCRDPGLEKFIWCNYQTPDNQTKREECSVRLPSVANTSNYDWKYMGEWSKTYSGRTCQRWEAVFPQGQISTGYHFPGETITSVANHCRDPWNSGYLWCYTMDQNMRWEPCVVDDNPVDRCLANHKVYLGSWNSSFTGKQCRRWDDISLPGIWFPDGTVTNAANYCRDPNNDGYLWCYVHSDESIWEPCVSDDDVNARISTMEQTLHGIEYFKCQNGDEILLQNKCDDKFDCSDLSDETECLHSYREQKLTVELKQSSDIPILFEVSSHVQCSTKEWISVIARCDGVKDCLDATDEINCSSSETEENGDCLHDQFRCDDGDCIHVSQVCNFVVDCVDGSDEYCEYDVCKKTEYKCDNGQCISSDNRCNAFKHCIDGSDETFCDTCNTEDAFHCDIVKCIPLRLVCDKYRDCEDGSDEISCSQPEFASCEQWWDAGYRKSGTYVLGGLVADCDFDSVLTVGKMYTIIKNSDILWRDGDGVGYLYTRDTLREEDTRLYEIIKRPHYTCVQQVKQTCIPSHKATAEIDDSGYTNNFKHCACFKMTIHVGKSSEVGRCHDSNSTVSNQNDLIFIYNATLSLYRKIVLKNQEYDIRRGYQIIPGPTICEYNFAAKKDLLTCDRDVKTISSSQKCVYDIDPAGYDLGCRSGSHLQNCETFDCPEGTVKCPMSYCIPLKFVCDGELQCPDGDDEYDCGCESSETEVLLIHDAEGDSMHNLEFAKFAKQFQTKTNLIRTLEYVAIQPLQDFNLDDTVLKIKDTVIQPLNTLNRVQECQFNVMAKNFVSDVIISENKSTGIIFIVDSVQSNDLFNTLFRNFADIDPRIKLYRVMQDTSITFELSDRITNVSDVIAKRWKTLTAIGAEYFPEFCQGAAKVHCSNKYKCMWSKMCIPLDQVCDGQTQCVHGDDERLCNFICPENCTCIGYTANCSATGFILARSGRIPKTTRLINLSLNKDLSSILTSSHLNLAVLMSLNLSNCKIGELSRFAFRKIRNLNILDLSSNSIKVLAERAFTYLNHLRILRLEGNFDLEVIEPGAFSGLAYVRYLDFAGAQLTIISAYTFSGLNLEGIELSNNSIHEIEDFAFSDLIVKRINFEKNYISLFRKEIFTGVGGLKELKTPEFKFCCIRPTYLKEDECYPTKDEFSSCEDLMRLSALQTMLWLIGLSALFGNAMSIMYRLIYDRERLKIGFGIFVTNLALADFLMGVYLIIIAVADAVFRKRYIFMDEYWRNSTWCNLAGVLSTVSSEASVFFLCLITIDRLLVIKFPFGHMRFDKRKSIICASIVWMFSLFLAILPLAHESYFQNKFYTKSGVCIALPMTRDRQPGWLYSAAIFVGLNFATFVLVAFGQWSIFMEIRRVGSGLDRSGRTKDLKIARNLLLVVTTDFMCWFPIGVMGMMAMNGHAISGDVYAWTAVFILPINSALNPILYTVTAIIGRKKFNPRADEQTRSNMANELGNIILRYHRSVSRHFNVKEAPNTFHSSISSMLMMDCKLTPLTALRVIGKLATCLDVLHLSSLVIGDITTNTVFISIVKKKVIGDIQIRTEPTVSSKKDDVPDDVLKVGKIARALLSKCNQTDT